MLTKEELDQINRFSKAELTADQVYTFSVRLCDNEVDRDFERFGTEDLDRLGELFLGKSGIFDHQWSAKGQTAPYLPDGGGAGTGHRDGGGG
ncbi:MAG: hypothetical protein ACLU38_06450 [Dysosmobacter sp.]